MHHALVVSFGLLEELPPKLERNRCSHLTTAHIFFDGCQKPPTRHAFVETNSLPLKNRPVMIIQARLPIVDVLAGTQFGNDAEKHWDRCQKQIF